MNILEIILAVLLGYSFYKGYKRGFINRLAAILGLVLAYNFTGLVVGQLHQYLVQNQILEATTSKWITYVIAFIGIIILVRVAGLMMVKLLKLLGINVLNKFAGGVLNLAQWFLIFSILIYFGSDLHILGEKWMNDSQILQTMKEVGDFMVGRFFETKLLN